MTQKGQNTINKRVETSTDIDLPKDINSSDDWCYACQTNKECSAMSAGIFKSHVMNTHTSFDSNALPPDHTIVIEENFETSTKN